MSDQQEVKTEQGSLVTTPEQAIKAMFEMCLKLDFTAMIQGSKPTLEYAKGFDMELQRIYQLALSGIVKQPVAPQEIEDTKVIDDNQKSK